MTERNPDRPKRDPKVDEDLRQNPGIGQSQGAYAMGGDLDYAEGDSTVEGDAENDSSPAGGAPATRLPRTNR